MLYKYQNCFRSVLDTIFTHYGWGWGWMGVGWMRLGLDEVGFVEGGLDGSDLQCSWG